MTDALPRLRGGFDEKAPALDRRQLLKVGAWAAPVLLLATAAPAASASTKAPATPPTAYGNAIINSSMGAQGNQGSGKIAAQFGFYYSPTGFADFSWGNPAGFQLLTTTWTLSVTKDGASAPAYSESGTKTITYANGAPGTPTSVDERWGTGGTRPFISGLAAGGYTVAITYTSATFTANGKNYAANAVVPTPVHVVVA